MPGESYAEFLERVREIRRANAIESLLAWDQETYMPRRGAADRAQQLALIAGVAHDRLTSADFAGLLARVERDTPPGDSPEAANVREMRRLHDRAARVPTELVREIARCSALAKAAWQEARRLSRFGDFAPHLERLLELKRRVADCVGYKTEPYDALLDEYEPGAKSADIERVFHSLRPQLSALVAAISSAPRRPDVSVLKRGFPLDKQRAFVQRVLEAMGFDFERGRLDVSAHPFCSGQTPADVRLTTRYQEQWLPAALFGAIHEAGHGLYEQGLDAAHTDTPMAMAVSLGIHESQSRMWENLIARGRPFWEHWFAPLQAEFPALADVTLDAFHFAVNAVSPSFIRVEADEVTYNLHIMLRFDVERRLLRGELPVRDVPDAWNTAMRDYLGITPPDDARGCLQDIHWALGIFGYFPTYALGNLYAAQFLAAARRTLGDLDGMVRGGNLTPLREWVRDNIHRHGMRYPADVLCRRVTGAQLSDQPFIDYLHAKYRPLYGLP